MSGGIWNGLDDNDETPGDVAARLGLKGLYTLCVEAGVRAELLFGLLDGYEELESDDGEEEEDESTKEEDGEDEAENAEGDAGAAPEAVAGEEVVGEEAHVFVSKRAQGPNVNSEDYLRLNLTYSDGKLVDSEQNGVMSMYQSIHSPLTFQNSSFPRSDYILTPIPNQ